jgi:hypothetical protein
MARPRFFALCAVGVLLSLVASGCCYMAICEPWWAFRSPAVERIIPIQLDDGTNADKAAYLYGRNKYLLETTVYRTMDGKNGSDRIIALLLRLEIKDGSSKPKMSPSDIRVSADCGFLPVVEKSAHGSWASRDLYLAELECTYPDSCSCFKDDNNAGSNCSITVDFGRFVAFKDTIAVFPRLIALDADSAWTALRSLHK